MAVLSKASCFRLPPAFVFPDHIAEIPEYLSSRHMLLPLLLSFLFWPVSPAIRWTTASTTLAFQSFRSYLCHYFLLSRHSQPGHSPYQQSLTVPLHGDTPYLSALLSVPLPAAWILAKAAPLPVLRIIKPLVLQALPDRHPLQSHKLFFSIL